MDDALQVYWNALERLKRGKPINVMPGGRITNDQVSLEAGRSRGSIKKSRPVFAKLISAIEDASKAKNKPSAETQEKYLRKRAEAENYKAQYKKSIAREISMLKQINELKQEIDKLRSDKIKSLPPN